MKLDLRSRTRKAALGAGALAAALALITGVTVGTAQAAEKQYNKKMYYKYEIYLNDVQTQTYATYSLWWSTYNSNSPTGPLKGVFDSKLGIGGLPAGKYTAEVRYAIKGQSTYVAQPICSFQVSNTGFSARYAECRHNSVNVPQYVDQARSQLHIWGTSNLGNPVQRWAQGFQLAQ